MKKILVTGCNGQLGRAIRKEYEKEDVTFINTDVAEAEGIRALDITDIDSVLTLTREVKPDVIINCAAHTNVDACETQWDLAYKINAIGPRNLSIAAAELGAKMIHVSTDYVFEGNGTRHIPNLMRQIRSVLTARRSWRASALCVNSPESILSSGLLGCMEMARILQRPCFAWQKAMRRSALCATSRAHLPVRWNWRGQSITMNPPRTTACSMRPVREIPTGQNLQRQFLHGQGSRQK